VTELLELVDGAFADPVLVALAKLIGALFAVQLAGLQHVPGGAKDLVADRDDRLLVTATGGQTPVALR